MHLSRAMQRLGLPNIRNLLASLVLLLALGACATTQAGPNGLADRDPYEELNRDIFSANQAVDGAVIRPVADVYRAVAPTPVRRGVTNFFGNLREPWSFVNNVLQGSPDRALRNLGRFVVNSTVGIGGLIDVASAIGIERAPEDFGQTLAVWGVGDGGYRVLPLFGPTTARGLVGTVVDLLANPMTLFLDRELNFSTGQLWALRAGDIVNARANATEGGVDAFLESSADPYAAARAGFFERREADILNYDTAGLGEDGVGDPDAAFEAALDEFDADQGAAPNDPVGDPVSGPAPESNPDSDGGLIWEGDMDDEPPIPPDAAKAAK